MKKLILMILLAAPLLASNYYADYSTGSDSNPGTKDKPWKRVPGMNGFSGSYSPATTDDFILRGSVTWPSTCFPLKPVASGDSASNITYSSDSTWYAGAAWARPVLDGEYIAAEIVSLNGKKYLTFDGLEMKRINPVSNFGYGLISGGSSTNILIKNCLLRSWRTKATTDDAHGGVIFVFGNPATGADTVVIDGCEIENSENANNGVCVRSVGIILNSRIHDNSSGILFCLRFDKSQLYNINGKPFDGSYHPNGLYMDPATFNIGQNGFITGSDFHDVGAGANMAYPNVRAGYTVTIDDCVFYGTQSAQQAIEIEPYQYGGEGAGNCTITNSVIVNYFPNSPAVNVVNRSSSGQKVGVLTMRGNRVIGTGAYLTNGNSSTVNSIVESGTIVQTVAEATAAGYTLANHYRPGSVVIDPIPAPIQPVTSARFKSSVISGDGKSITITIE